MVLLNFTHPLSAEQISAVERLCGQAIERVIDAPAQLDPALPFAPQVSALLTAVPLTAGEWQSVPLIVNLPAFSLIAALVLAALHGRCGYFPAVLRLRSLPGAVPPIFEIAEVINLQAAREGARAAR